MYAAPDQQTQQAIKICDMDLGVILAPPLVKDGNQIVGERCRAYETGRRVVPVGFDRQQEVHLGDSKRAEVAVYGATVIVRVYYAKSTAEQAAHARMALDAFNRGSRFTIRTLARRGEAAGVMDLRRGLAADADA